MPLSYCSFFRCKVRALAECAGVVASWTNRVERQLSTQGCPHVSTVVAFVCASGRLTVDICCTCYTLAANPASANNTTQTPVAGTQSMIGSAVPRGLLADPRVHAAWALFFSKFITAYKELVSLDYPGPPRPFRLEQRSGVLPL